MREPVLNYARSNGLAVTELEDAFEIEIPKGEILIKVTVLKDNEVLEWFIAAYDTHTHEERFSSYSDHFYTSGQPREARGKELDAYVLATVKALHQNEVGIAESPPVFHLFGKPFLRRLALQYRSGSEWKEWDDVDHDYSR
jgi:hypothetical protein